jgi:hypothetical protein
VASSRNSGQLADLDLDPDLATDPPPPSLVEKTVNTLEFLDVV